MVKQQIIWNIEIYASTLDSRMIDVILGQMVFELIPISFPNLYIYKEKEKETTYVVALIPPNIFFL